MTMNVEVNQIGHRFLRADRGDFTSANEPSEALDDLDVQ